MIEGISAITLATHAPPPVGHATSRGIAQLAPLTCDTHAALARTQ